MNLPILNTSPADRRVIAMLGSFSFLMLGGLTTIGIAADAMFLSELGAAKMAFGIIVGQALVIPVFRLYGALRARLKARWVAPVVVSFLALLLIAVFLWQFRSTMVAAVALFVFVPCLAGIMGSENGRVSASLLNPRSARRLFPTIGSIGGIGASFGALISGEVSGRFGEPLLIPIGALFLLATLVPAWACTKQLRPSPKRKKSENVSVRKHRYALILVLSAGFIAAITTLLRFQLGAAAVETYGEAGLGVFYSRLSLIINLCSIGFTLVITRTVINRLGAANSLIFYPLILLVLATAAIFAPTLMLIAVAASSERLVRQNVHRTVSTLAKMPLHVRLRVRMALLASGSSRPLGTILASVAILVLTGELGLLPLELGWQAFSLITAPLAAVVLGGMLYVRRRYIRELVGSLHARRLQLENLEEAALPMDPQVRTMLAGYLRSDLSERSALAMKLLENNVDDEVVAAIAERWPDWDASLCSQALGLLAEHPTSRSLELIDQISANASDEVQAVALGLKAAALDDDALTETAWKGEGQTRAEAIAALINRHGGEGLDLLMTKLAGSENESDKRTVARVIAKLESARYDHMIPGLLAVEPASLLQTIAQRPNGELASECAGWLQHDQTFVAARAALLAIGEAAVPALTAAAISPRISASCFDILVAIGGNKARTALFSFIDSGEEDQQSFRALSALAQSDSPLSEAEKLAVEASVVRWLDVAESLERQGQNLTGAAATLANNEKEFSVEMVFVSLDVLYDQLPFRRLFLASQASDERQHALAAETLDEFLPGKFKRRILALIEGSAASRGKPKPGSVDAEDVSALAPLLESGLFPGWRRQELAALISKPCAMDAACIVIRENDAIGLEDVLLTGKSPTAQDGDIRIDLHHLFEVIADNTRLGGLWLRGLAQRVSDPEGSGKDVTRSEMLSLASKTLGDDQDVARDIDIWQRVFFLRTMAMTQSLPPHRLRLLAEISRTLSAEEGETIINEGRLGNHFYMVCSGALEVSGKGTPLTRLGPSDAFGALSLMRGARRSFSVKAVEKTELLTIDRVDFLDLIDAHPALVRSFTRTLAVRIKAAREFMAPASAQ